LGVGSGEWRVESGEWRVESGEWRVESAPKRNSAPTKNFPLCKRGIEGDLELKKMKNY
jgi:hypothetical protein